MVTAPDVFAIDNLNVCASVGLPTVCEKLFKTPLVATTGIFAMVVPVTATFCVMAPALSLVILPADVPAAVAFNRTRMVVTATTPLAGVSVSGDALLYQFVPLTDTW